MPDLGKAVYTLVFDTSQASKMARAEEQVVASTDAMAAGVTTAETAVMRLGTSVGISTAKIGGSFAKAGTEAQAGAAEIAAAGGEAAAGAEKAALVSSAALSKAGNAWLRFGHVGGRMGHLLGLGALYETIKLGTETLHANQSSFAQVNNVLESTGHIAGVTGQHALELAHHWEMVAGSERNATQQMMAVLLGFTNIRNEAGKGNQVFDRTVQAIENVSARTGKSLQTVSVAVGKALQDPGKYLMALARTGVTFTKTQLATVQAMVAANRPMEAQKFILDALEKRYGAARGAAWAFGQTTSGQMAIAKNAIGEAAAKVLTAFIPAFMQLTHIMVQVANVISHHTTALRRLVYAYLALKAAAVATRLAMTAMPFAKLIAGFTGLATAEKGAVLWGARLRVALLSLGGVAVLTAIGAAIAAVVILKKTIADTNKAFDQLDAANAHAAGGSELQASEMMFANRRTQDYVQQGMNPAKARAQAIADTRKQFNDPGFSPQSGGAASQGEGSTASPLDNSTFTVNPAKKKKKKKKKKGYGTSGLNGLLPLGLQIQEQEATRQGQKAVDAVLRKEQSYLEGLLKNRKLSLSKRLEIETELTNVWQQLQADAKKAGRKNKAGLIPASMDIALQKAEQTKNLKVQKKVLLQEEDYLKGLLNNSKLTLAKRDAIEKQLTATLKKIDAVNKKIQAGILTTTQKFDQQMQAYVDTRGSFFSQFASSVFHSGPMGLAMGALTVNGGGGNSMTYNQNNTFHEIPKDRYALSRQMQQAAAGAMG